MRILVLSDLHSEFWRDGRFPPFETLPDPSQYDVIVAAGDIGTGTTGLYLLAASFQGKEIIYVPGNHEYYHHDMPTLNQQLQKEAAALTTVGARIHLLNPGSVTVGGYTFIGATHWSDLCLSGYPDLPSWSVERMIADFKVITNGPRRFSADDCRKLYDEQSGFIIDQLDQTPDIEKTVVVTHFVPVQACIATRWVGNPLNPYFTNDFNAYRSYPYPLHIFGHTHDPHDTVAGNWKTRFVCSPFGYPNEHGKEHKHTWKIVELG